ncbi:TEKT3 [Acanthosepion pharaonis]|uniref:Tektin n=1 Tax=Acanthosepion pharaonis TaxID=158019 RepID=A0A812EQE7_ACAPH|nr:TEKT3 [Sepia pharaonis]
MFGLTRSLPTIGQQQSIFPNHAPPPLRRSFTTLPWRPSTYYQSSNTNPNLALCKRVSDPLSRSAQISALDPYKVPSIYQSARSALYTRYTPKEWECSNQNNYYTSDHLRTGAERLRFDTMRMCKEVDDKTKRTQTDVGKRLGERINDIVFWKNELLRETDELLKEMAVLNESKRMVEKALLETENPLNIAQECLYNREKRQGIDLVHDTPEMVLIKEVEVIKKSQDKLRNVIDRANAQLSLNRAAQHELEKDTGDKFTAQNLDENAFQLRNTSRGINFHNGLEKIDNTLSVPETWCMFTNNNIKRSQAERATSKHLRNEIDTVLNTCCNDMWHQWNSTNQALTDRIKETIDARNKLQTHLSKVLQEIFDMNKNIEFIKKSIQDKQAPLQVAQTRLDTRLRRPNVESCKDSAHIRLVEEVDEIRDTLETLQKKLRQAENSLQELLCLKTKLEEELAVKNNSLFIDREKCLAMRKTFPMAPICGVRINTSSEITLNH